MNDQEGTERVACKNCGVVSEVDYERRPPENAPDLSGLLNPRITDDECAVCGNGLHVSDQAIGGDLP